MQEPEQEVVAPEVDPTQPPEAELEGKDPAELDASATGDQPEQKPATAARPDQPRTVPIQRLNRIHAEKMETIKKLEAAQAELNRLKAGQPAASATAAPGLDLTDIGLTPEELALLEANPGKAVKQLASKEAERIVDERIKKVVESQEKRQKYLNALQGLGQMPIAKKDPEFASTVQRIIEENPQLSDLEPEAAANAIKGLYFSEYSAALAARAAQTPGGEQPKPRDIKGGLRPPGSPPPKPRGARTGEEILNMPAEEWEKEREKWGFGTR